MAEKIFTYIVITVGIMLFLNAAGFVTAGSVALGWLGIEGGDLYVFKLSSLFTTFLVVALGALAASGVIIGIFGKGSLETSVTALYATPLIALIGDLILTVTLAEPGTHWAGYLIMMLMSPLIAGYVIALYDWVRGRD